MLFEIASMGVRLVDFDELDEIFFKLIDLIPKNLD